MKMEKFQTREITHERFLVRHDIIQHLKRLKISIH